MNVLEGFEKRVQGLIDAAKRRIKGRGRLEEAREYDPESAILDLSRRVGREMETVAAAPGWPRLSEHLLRIAGSTIRAIILGKDFDPVREARDKGFVKAILLLLRIVDASVLQGKRADRILTAMERGDEEGEAEAEAVASMRVTTPADDLLTLLLQDEVEKGR